MLLFYLSLIETDEGKSKFEKLYYKYRWLMFSVAKEILKNKQLAEDATQEAFIKIARAMDKIEDVDSHKTKNFVVIITRNACLDMLDKEKRHMGMAHIDDMEVSETTEYFDLETLALQSVVEAIKELSPEYRDVIQLKYYYNFKEKEIADALGITYAAVRKRLERARNRLSILLEERR